MNILHKYIKKLKNKAAENLFYPSYKLTVKYFCSLLLIVYLSMLIFGRKEQDTITIRGRIVTITVTYSEPVEVSGRTIDQK